MTRRRGLAPVANQEHRVLELQLPLRLLFLGSQSVMSPILATFVNHLSKSVHIQAGTTNHLGLTCHVVQLRLPLHQLISCTVVSLAIDFTLTLPLNTQVGTTQ